MSAYESDSPPGSKRRWPWVVGAIAIVLALIVGVSIWYQSRQPEATPAPAPVATSSSPATSAVGDSPNGCLAGTTNETETLLSAQANTPQTEAGAVSVAAAIFRWGLQYPRPTEAEGIEVAEAAVASNSSGTLTKMAENFASPQPVEGVTSFRLSFADGRYLVREKSDKEMDVVLGASQVLNGRQVDEKTASVFTMVWEDDRWKIRSDSSEGINLENLYKIGATFAGGC